MEYRDVTDNQIKDLQTKKVQLEEKMKDCENENFSLNIGKKLNEVLNLKVLTPKILHSLVERITGNHEGNISCLLLK